MNLKCLTLIIAAGLCLSGCASTSTSSSLAAIALSEGGTKIRILPSEQAATSCEKLQEVRAYPPYFLPDDARNTLRNNAAMLGADAIYVTNYLIAPATANAYRCEGPHRRRS